MLLIEGSRALITDCFHAEVLARAAAVQDGPHRAAIRRAAAELGAAGFAALQPPPRAGPAPRAARPAELRPAAAGRRVKAGRVAAAQAASRQQHPLPRPAAWSWDELR